jgi:hypothetical protein
VSELGRQLCRWGRLVVFASRPGWAADVRDGLGFVAFRAGRRGAAKPYLTAGLKSG